MIKVLFNRMNISLILFIVLISVCTTTVNAESINIKNGQIFMGEQQVKLIGANIAFWNRRWQTVTKEELQQDIKQIKQIGNCARIFVPYVQDNKGFFGTLQARKGLLDKLEYFVSEAQQQGIVVIVCFLFMRYDEINANQKFVTQILNRLKNYKNVIYDIQNEPDLEAQYIPERRPQIGKWCNQMAKFVKENDIGHHLVTIGFSGIDMIFNKEIDLNSLDIISFHLGGRISPYILKRRILKLRNFFKEQAIPEKPIAIEEIGLSSKDFDEKTRAEEFQNLWNTAKELNIPIFLWWVLRDVPKDLNAVDGDRIQIEPHRWGIFNSDRSTKGKSTEVAIECGREATKLDFKGRKQ